MRPTSPALLACVLSFLVVAGCTSTPQQSTNGSTTTTTSTTPPTTNATTNASPSWTLTYVATQSGPPGNDTTYAFDGPSKALSGWVQVTLQNKGLEFHQAVIYRLGNMTYAAALASLHDPNATPDLKPVGGVAAASPGSDATVTLHLTPGAYAIACFIPGGDGMPHALHGMTKELTVVNETGQASPPAADANLTLSDYAFTFDHKPSAGAHVIAVKNVANHTHEAVLVKLHAGKNMSDFIAFVTPGANTTGGPPADAMGMTGAAAPGTMTQYATVTLAAGNYGLICFESDGGPNDPPHFVKGMVMEFAVT